MPPTRPRKFGRGSCGILGTTCTSLPRTVPGSTRWSAGSPYCHNARSNEVRTTACVNWNPPSWSSSRCTTSSPNPLCGPRVPMPFSTALDGSLPVLWPHTAQTICKKSVTQETSRMLGDVEVQDASTAVADDEEAIEHAKVDRWHREEVHGRNRFPVVSKEGEPAFSWLGISRRPFHPTRNGSLAEIKTEHKKLAVNARRSPGWILNNHPEDQLSNFLRRRLPPHPRPDSRDQFPYKRKPARCQRITVSGATTIRACFQPDQKRLTATQNSLSNGLRRGLRRRRFNTASCWRNARFSRSRLWRTRKKRTSIPRHRRMNRNMARSYNRKLAGDGGSYVIDFTAGQSFGE